MTNQTGKYFAPGDYLEAIKDTDAGTNGGLVGQIKPSDNPGSLRYAHPASCQTWIEIRHDDLQSIEHLGFRRCGDHRHPMARLTFKPSDDPLHATLLSLAQLHQDLAPMAGDDGCPPGQHRCYDAGSHHWTCC